ncbi:sigma factor-like helix-turn-helix DNA-binding protein [Streptomyces sp. NRRL F-5135]|uniref:sigma factor-like helix-turn-helix DNA-binding protein n=1 Tax=Streptomyces sp. NRRL F-5135 TaxID=1463858 RepID=UPI0004C98CDC|nr:sigma factor-like helix-turn-helix DNA-binding protein [Streptomyces sp. NRRL F-5135]
MTRNTTRRARAGAAAISLPPPEERRGLREARSMTERQIAAAVGVSRSTLRSWERGRTSPRGPKGEAYARLLTAGVAEPRKAGARSRRPGRTKPGEGTERTTGSAATETARSAEASTSSERGRPPDRDNTGRDAAHRGAAVRDAADRGTAHRDAAGRVAGTEQRGAKLPGTTAPGVEAARPDAAGGRRAGGDARPTAPYITTGTAPRTAEKTPETSAGRNGGTAADGPDTAGDSGAAADTEMRLGTFTEVGPLTPGRAFDALYARNAPALLRQAYLLTGLRGLSQESVEHAFRLAWERWPEVATDRDPAGWVRAAAHEYALSPWHRMRHLREEADVADRKPDRAGRKARKRREEQPAEPARDEGPADRALREALLDLPPTYRRAVLLYDGLGLDLPETAAETEASTAAAASRLTHARAALAERLPELADPALLHARLGALTRAAAPAVIPPPRTVRTACERRARRLTRSAVAFTVLIIGATSFTLATAPRQYIPPLSPGERIGGVPVSSGPQRLSKQDLELRRKLRAEPVNGPSRLVPEAR